MSKFPASEAGILDLCQQMIDGYTAHAADFPSVTVDVLGDLQAARASYNGNRTNQDQAQAQAKVATANKVETLESLAQAMRNTLKLSEIDCTTDPEKLAYIGWGFRAPMQTLGEELPVQPDVLSIKAEGPSDIWLSWQQGSKSLVRHWLVERRQQTAPGAEYGPWTLVGTSLGTEIHLTDQPVGLKLEYRVIAENSDGQSPASNSVFAVL
jgi:hypothetical protein